jgi:Spy/CpxP family protein refolding chaperone
MIRTLSFIASFLLVWTSVGFAQPGPQDRPGQRMERRHQFRDQLSLSEDQEAQMKQMHLDLEKKQTQLQPKIRLARIAMKEAMLADQPDRGVFEKNIKAITDLQLEMKMNRLDHWFKVYKLLTPEQQRIWKEHFGEGPMMDGDEPSGMRPSPAGPRDRR